MSSKKPDYSLFFNYSALHKLYKYTIEVKPKGNVVVLKAEEGEVKKRHK